MDYSTILWISPLIAATAVVREPAGVRCSTKQDPREFVVVQIRGSALLNRGKTPVKHWEFSRILLSNLYQYFVIVVKFMYTPAGILYSGGVALRRASRTAANENVKIQNFEFLTK